MTAAQKANVARFKAVQAEAKKLKAKNKNLTHVQAVKQAWAIMLHKKPGAKKKVSGLDKVIKNGNKTTVLYTKKVKKKAAAKKEVKQGKLFSGIKKKPTEKAILKKVHSAKTSSKNLFNKLDKLDEAQHAHMSGINKQALNDYKEVINKILFREKYINHHKLAIKNKKLQQQPGVIQQLKKQLISEKKYLTELKKHKTELKKFL